MPHTNAVYVYVLVQASVFATHISRQATPSVWAFLSASYGHAIVRNTKATSVFCLCHQTCLASIINLKGAAGKKLTQKSHRVPKEGIFFCRQSYE